MKDDLISREAAIDRLNATPPGNWSKARYTRELWNVPSVPAVPLEPLCKLLAPSDACPPGYPGAQNLLCKKNECALCWKQFLTKWMEEQDAKEKT